MNNLINSVIHTVAIDNTGTNWVFSPASYMEAMFSLSLCVNGNNLREIVEVASKDDGNPSADTKYYPLTKDVNSYNCLLTVAEYEPALNPSCVSALENIGSDFKTFSDPDNAVYLVNDTVNHKTHGKIPTLLDRGDVDDLTKFILLNCVYFKKEWLCPLRKNWIATRFVNYSGSFSDVYMLHGQTEFMYYEADTFDIVELRYENCDIACYLFVPNKYGDIFSILDGFTTNYHLINKVKTGLSVDLTVPSFEVESRFDLSDYTKLAGVQSVFNATQEWNLVDFTKAAPDSVFGVGKIIQKATIDFDEHGTEATAATAILITGCASGCFIGHVPPKIKTILADQPFVYCLVDRQHPETPLFVGAINELPSSSTNQPYGSNYPLCTG